MGEYLLCMVAIGVIAIFCCAVVIAAIRKNHRKIVVGVIIASLLASSSCGYKMGSTVADEMIEKYHVYKEIIEEHYDEFKDVLSELEVR